MLQFQYIKSKGVDLSLKKPKPIYIYKEDEEVIIKAINVLNKNKDKLDAKVTFSNFATDCMLTKAKEILKEIEE